MLFRSGIKNLFEVLMVVGYGKVSECSETDFYSTFGLWWALSLWWSNLNLAQLLVQGSMRFPMLFETALDKGASLESLLEI